MIGLAPKTLAITEAVSSLTCIKDFVLVGGTGIATQINHRLSEDLDFCKWVPVTSPANGIDVKSIEKELRQKFENVRTNQLSFDQVDFYVKNVKITYFNEVGYKVPEFKPLKLIGNIQSAPLELIASMKIKTMFERNTFRDYYDVYVLLKEEIISLNRLINSSISYQPKLKAHMILNRLQRWQYVDDEAGFIYLNPKYKVSRKEIGEFLINVIDKNN